MIHPAIPVSLFVLVAPAAAALGDPTEADGQQRAAVGRVTIHERILIRIPRMSLAPAPVAAPAAITWKEKKGPKCIDPAELGGAIFGKPDRVDLVLIGNRRVRARLDGDCSAMDFYSGVYLRAGIDGKICADRDAIRTRSGATCGIDSFRTLVAKR